MDWPRRTLADWTPDAGPEDEWLARWAADGWEPEYGYGVEVTIGAVAVKRWAMVRWGEGGKSP